MARAQADNGIHVFPAVIADRLEHALDGGHHLAEDLDAARFLRGRGLREALDQVFHGERNGRDDGVAVKRRRPLETVGHDHEGVQDPRGDRLT
jgi:hypothetical protein